MALTIPQVETVTRLSRNYKEVFARLKKGPVFLAQQAEVTAVMLSPTEYEKLTEDARRWQRQNLADQRSQELKDNPNLAVSLDQLERGLVDA